MHPQVTGNPKPRVVSVKGRGGVISLSFDPPRASIGPLLPLAAPASVPVRVVNPSNVPVEVYSLDFDTQYVPMKLVGLIRVCCGPYVFPAPIGIGVRPFKRAVTLCIDSLCLRVSLIGILLCLNQVSR